MARTVIALYDDVEHARDAVNDLIDNGFERERVSIVANDARSQYRDIEGAGAGKDMASDVGAGAGIGAVLGGIAGLVVGLGAFTIPGIGPLIAAGPLATTLAGLGVGAAAGGLVGALTNLGIPEEDAQTFAEGVRRGGTLVTVETDDERSNLAVDIINRHNPVDMERRSSEWRQANWQGFRPDAEPLSADEIDHERQSRTMPVGYDEFEPLLRNHFQENYTGTDYAYEDMDQAYRYGYDLAHHDRYRGRGWEEIERDARDDWEMRNREYAWEDYRNAIRHGWLLGTRR